MVATGIVSLLGGPIIFRGLTVSKLKVACYVVAASAIAGKIVKPDEFLA
jgi:hypothetical protein